MNRILELGDVQWGGYLVRIWHCLSPPFIVTCNEFFYDCTIKNMHVKTSKQKLGFDVFGPIGDSTSKNIDGFSYGEVFYH